MFMFQLLYSYFNFPISFIDIAISFWIHIWKSTTELYSFGFIGGIYTCYICKNSKFMCFIYLGLGSFKRLHVLVYPMTEKVRMTYTTALYI